MGRSPRHLNRLLLVVILGGGMIAAATGAVHPQIFVTPPPIADAGPTNAGKRSFQFRHPVQATDTVLHQAAASGDVDLARYLLDRGTAVDLRAEADG